MIRSNPNVLHHQLTALFPDRNRVLVALDWVKARLFGRDVSRE